MRSAASYFPEGILRTVLRLGWVASPGIQFFLDRNIYTGCVRLAMHALWRCSLNAENSTQTYKYPEIGVYYCSDWAASPANVWQTWIFSPQRNHVRAEITSSPPSIHGNHKPVQLDQCYEAVCQQSKQGGRGNAKLNGILLLGTWGTQLCS